MSQTPLISIVTPSYNQGSFIEETIQSVQFQDYPHREHLIIDNQSSDDTLKILRNYESLHNMDWVSEHDEGQADAIQKGFSRSEGEILCWLNADDIYLSPGVLSRVVSYFVAYPEAMVITGGGMIVSKDGQWIRQTDMRPERINYRLLRYRNHILQPATFFRKSVLETVPLNTALHYTFDWDFWIRLAKRYNILAVNEVWAGYRMWDLNKTALSPSQRTWEQAEVTGTHLGFTSWQYLILKTYFYLNKSAETTPAKIQPTLKSILRGSSRILSRLTRNRIAVI